MKEKSSPHLPLTTYHLPSKALPLIMHIDLNSCFATIEAQANRLLRGRPVGVAAYDTPRGFVLAANYAAKAKGVPVECVISKGAGHGFRGENINPAVPEITKQTVAFFLKHLTQ